MCPQKTVMTILPEIMDVFEGQQRKRAISQNLNYEGL